MSALTTAINDRFIQLVSEKDPALHEKLRDGGFMLLKLATGEYQIFASHPDLTNENMQEVQPILAQAVRECLQEGFQ